MLRVLGAAASVPLCAAALVAPLCGPASGAAPRTATAAARPDRSQGGSGVATGPGTSAGARAAVRATIGTTTRAVAAPKEGDVRGHRRILIVRYHVVHDCVVQPNAGRAQGTWVVPAGGTINWRYNVTRSVAAVSDPRRKAKGFPWWGFVTDSSCIGTSVGQTGSYKVFHHGRWVTHRLSYPAGRPRPQRILQGRSQFRPYWRAVDYTPAHGARPSHLVRMRHNATLRDRPNRFVIGNVFSGWRVRSRSAHSHGWTKVYVPVLRRWGYVIV